MSDNNGPLLETLVAVISGAGLSTIVTALIAARSRRAEKAMEAKQSEQHDVLALRQHLDSISDSRTKLAFEMLTAICGRQDNEIKRLEASNDALEADNVRLKEHEEDCADRLASLERQSAERDILGQERMQELRVAQHELGRALRRISELERTIRDAGLSSPPFSAK